MTEPAVPVGLSTRLLADPAMAAACAARDFTKIFGLAKARGGFHASRIARQCELTPSRVGEVMSGRRSITNMSVIERVADGLRIPGHMLGLATRAWEQRAPAPSRPKPQSAQNVSGSSFLPAPTEDLDSILAIAAATKVTPSTLRSLQTSIEDY
ncbi:hypothetical protein ACFO3J_19695 [Streptomyces polygonati]|uniref:HTH cro/C1-type domain-containing protein n=1 Tax=Streptomyces polygonati TaxID=1617087 RepID=A0ABV8HTQ4_9ACTN